MVLEMFNNEHDEVVILKLAQVLNHSFLHQRLQLAHLIDECLQNDVTSSVV